MYGGLSRPVLRHGNGLPGSQVRVRGRDGAGEKKRCGPVRVLENLGVLLIGWEGHPELEPAERCRQGVGRPPGGLPLGPPAGQGRGGRHHPPSTHNSAPSATITPSRLMAIPPNPVSLAECEPMLCAVGQAAERHGNTARREPYRWSRMPFRKLWKAARSAFCGFWEPNLKGFWDPNTKAVPWRMVTASSTRKPLPAGHWVPSSRAGAPPMVMARLVCGLTGQGWPVWAARMTGAV